MGDLWHYSPSIFNLSGFIFWTFYRKCQTYPKVEKIEDKHPCIHYPSATVISTGAKLFFLCPCPLPFFLLLWIFASEFQALYHFIHKHVRTYLSQETFQTCLAVLISGQQFLVAFTKDQGILMIELIQS